jgi:hypothetical protein
MAKHIVPSHQIVQRLLPKQSLYVMGKALGYTVPPMLVTIVTGNGVQIRKEVTL